MYNVENIANRLIHKGVVDNDPISNKKLQKLLYYEQGFHLAYFGKPLFEDDFEAWRYGPVLPKVYDKYERYGCAGITDYSEDFVRLTEEEEALFASVWDIYADYSATGLVKLTHGEPPWRTTKHGERISKAKMKKFFKTRLVDE